MAIIDYPTLFEQVFLPLMNEDHVYSSAVKCKSKCKRSASLPIALDVCLQNDKYFIKSNLPGILKEAIELAVEERSLTITAKLTPLPYDSPVTWLMQERPLQYHQGKECKLERTIALPEDADPENIKASFENGELCLEIPKRPKADTKRIIPF